VVDNFGGTAGLVTIQDVVAEIIGDTHEPESPAESNIRVLDDQTYLVQAQTDLEEVNDFLNLELPLSEEYQTLGGFVIYQLQKIPAVGEGLTYDTYDITVESGEGPRLGYIRLRRLEPSMVSEVTELIEAAEEAESPESSPLTESGFDSSGLDSQES
jgi:CBS domain containing-hemolysin-like protein